MRDHNTPTCTVGILSSLDSFGDGANLVDLEQQSIAGFEINGFLDKLRIRNSKIVTREDQSALLLRFGRILVPNNLEIGRLEEITPSFPIIFGKRILKRDNRILARKALVHFGKLLVR